MLTQYDELATKTFIPDTILPEQFFSEARHSSRSPEHRFWWAIFESGLDDLFRYHGAKTRRGRRLYSEAWQWMFGDDQSHCASFENVTANVGIDASAVQVGIRRQFSPLLPDKKKVVVRAAPKKVRTIRMGTSRRAWVAQSPDKDGFYVWARKDLELYRLKRFDTSDRAYAFIYWVRAHLPEAIGTRQPTERLMHFVSGQEQQEAHHVAEAA